MPFVGNLLIVLGQLTGFAIEILQLLIIIQVILSWVNVSLPLNRVTRLFYAVTEAIYRPIRVVIPTLFGGLDFAPLAALAGLYFVDRWLVSFIIQLGYRLAA